jgi:hypothetical protein
MNRADFRCRDVAGARASGKVATGDGKKLLMKAAPFWRIPRISGIESYASEAVLFHRAGWLSLKLALQACLESDLSSLNGSVAASRIG